MKRILAGEAVGKATCSRWGICAVLLLGAQTASGGVLINPGNGHGYALVVVGTGNGDGPSWSEAQAAAVALGASCHLATVTSQAENDFLVDNFLSDDPPRAWIGGTDAASEGNFEWITGEPFVFTFWGQDEPNGDVAENCLEYKDDLQGAIKWNDSPCAETDIDAYLVECSGALPTPLLSLYGLASVIGLLLAIGLYRIRARPPHRI